MGERRCVSDRIGVRQGLTGSKFKAILRGGANMSGEALVAGLFQEVGKYEKNQ